MSYPEPDSFSCRCVERKDIPGLFATYFYSVAASDRKLIHVGIIHERVGMLFGPDVALEDLSTSTLSRLSTG